MPLILERDVLLVAIENKDEQEMAQSLYTHNIGSLNKEYPKK